MQTADSRAFLNAMHYNGVHPAIGKGVEGSRLFADAGELFVAVANRLVRATIGQSPGIIDCAFENSESGSRQAYTSGLIPI